MKEVNPVKKFSTTVYKPVDPAGHIFQPSDPAIPNSRCTCGANGWDDIHKLLEEHVPDVVEPRSGLYCVEASDDRGRNYATNGLRWVKLEDAKRWASGLSMRWFGCTDIRVRETDEDGEPTGETVYQTLSSE